MVDSNDKERATEAQEELMRMLSEDELRDAVLLVFANKQASCVSLMKQPGIGGGHPGFAACPISLLIAFLSISLYHRA